MAVTGLLIAILASVVWGSADFAGGAATRKHHQFQVIALGSAAAVLPLVLVAVWQGEGLPDGRSVFWAFLAGFSGSLGLTVFYLGLARSSMAVVAPITSVVATILPMLFSIFTQGIPGTLQLVGFAVALAGIGLASRSTAEQPHHIRQGVIWALMAGVGFGIFLTLIAQVAEAALFGSLAVSKSTAVVVMLVLLRRRKLAFPKPGENMVAVLSGILDAGGNVFYLLATQLTRMDIAVVLASMGPVWTVVLARMLFKEKVSALQWLGVGLCMLAIVFISS